MQGGPLYSEPPRNDLVSIAVAVCRKMVLPHRTNHCAAAFTSHSTLWPEISSSRADRKVQTAKLGHDMESRAKRRAAKAFRLTHAAISSSDGFLVTDVGAVDQILFIVSLVWAPSGWTYKSTPLACSDPAGAGPSTAVCPPGLMLADSMHADTCSLASHKRIVVGGISTRAWTTSTNRSWEGWSGGICLAMAIKSFHISQRKGSMSGSALLNWLSADWLISSAMVAAGVVLEGCR